MIRSWLHDIIRNSLMAAARIDAEELMNQSVKFAEQMLRDAGELLPYGAAMKPDGKIVILGTSEENEDRSPEELIDALRDGYKAAAKNREFKATATIYNGHTATDESGDSKNAIVFELDHRDNYSVIMYWVYTLDEKEIHYSEFLSRPGDRRIF